MELLSEAIVPESARDVKRRARAFADEYIAPNAAEHFRTGAYPREILEAGRDAGLVAQDIAEEYGGQGLSLAEELAIAEEFFRTDAGIGLALNGASFGAKILEAYGTDEQREAYLRPVAEGEKITGMAVSEPDTGSDLAGMETRAERDGDEWVLNGEKYWIGNGVVADWILVYARTDDSDDRHGNHSIFIVPTDAEGYAAEPIPEKIGMRASQQARVVFDDCRIPDANLVDQEGAGFEMVTEFFNRGRLLVSGQGIGLAAAAVEETWEFVHEREGFDRQIADFQAIQHALADMRIEFESARSLVWRAADRLERDENAGLWAAMAKTKATETATDVSERGMQYHGGRSVLSDRRIARVFRDARMPVIYEGVNEIQRDLVYRHW